ncbi:MAG: sigma-70 family RNA polymerase sigma factor [Thermomicrobiales bacterium]
MDREKHERQADCFEANRSHLGSVAYRILGSASEAEDAVQETWLRFSRSDTTAVDNLRGWLTQVVARICLDMLRSRKSRREESLDALGHSPQATDRHSVDPEQEALLADAVGLAMLVVLDRLDPAERLAFVLHDMFAIPFDEIAPIVARTPAATRQLASRARRRVRGTSDQRPPEDEAHHADRRQQRAAIDAFLAAARNGDLEGLLALLAPDVVFRSDAVPALGSESQEVRGAMAVAPLAIRGRARAARLLLVNGAVGVVVAPRGRLLMVLTFTIQSGQIVAIDAIADPDRLAQLELAVPEDQ